ncbi:MAG: hypothetical protein B7C54_00265 [Acidimicrobiales bacterium mtb01]|nr:hypothetical protein [Actinomycetota bacterium]TEX48705.1 MAG: hypothetical protein B7C54_00265 [Acidimicrobiales bacterium mtb01]
MANDVLRPTRADALRAATETFLAGEPIHLGALAASLGVSRVTVHRWVGTRRDLLDAIAVRLSVTTMARCVDDQPAGASPAERVAQGLARFVATANATGAVAAFVRREGLEAIEALADPVGGVRPRLRGYIESLLAREGALTDAHQLALSADGVLRVIESHIWLGALVDAELDQAALAEQLRRLLQPSAPESRGA